MAEDTSGIERESPALESLYPEAKPAVTASTRRTENAGFVPKCIADQKYPIAATVVFTIMTITIIALAVRKPPPCPPTPPPIDAACPDSWIGYEGKCYYWSDQENNWNISKENCSSFSASLAMLDSEEELLQHSRWLLVALCIGNVILVVAVIALALQLEAEKRKPGTGGQIPSDSVENFQLHLRSKLCNQTQDSISGSLACHLCPADWHLHKDKCYWPSEDLKFWNQSRDYCFTRGSQLAVIQSQEELGFIQKLLSDQRYWIGLEWSGTKWTWITGSQLDPNMFQEPRYTPGSNCGQIKHTTKDPIRHTIASDKCATIHQWVCQKEAFLL
ncbi:C-type lectin domain family 7 member A-like isoform X2 [Varanus komodoensis]|uniref:C-type lectin domain family 7 member A-like isoform X2 n=1 Tax=Varanus komodoensis TaxID=61221 RepID=UPI001CF77033|nr:C-type lectin domain family 7 member A-like isoform X2 [Varanus komodoensis]